MVVELGDVGEAASASFCYVMASMLFPEQWYPSFTSCRFHSYCVLMF